MIIRVIYNLHSFIFHHYLIIYSKQIFRWLNTIYRYQYTPLVDLMILKQLINWIYLLLTLN